MKNSKPLFPSTEPDVDLKIRKRTPGRLQMGERIHGTMVRDGRFHYEMTEDEPTTKRLRRKTRYVYRGELVNVVEQPDGTRILTLRRVCFVEKSNKTLAFMSYCCKLLREISQIVRMTRI